MEDVKIKLSVLWLFGQVALLTFLVLEFLEPGVIQGIMAGNMKGLFLGPEMLLFYAFSLLIPLVMAFLSLTLKGSINRWVNIVLGMFFTGLYLSDLFAHLANPYAHAILMGCAAVVAQVLIVWYAWKWK
jgi:hypothetical protein